MTFYTTLKEAQTVSGNTVTAYKFTEKFSDHENYGVMVSREGIAFHVSTCARTTWKRKFAELAGEY